MKALLKTVPGAVVERNSVLPEKVPAGGLIIVRDSWRASPNNTLCRKHIRCHICRDSLEYRAPLCNSISSQSRLRHKQDHTKNLSRKGPYDDQHRGAVAE